MKTNVKQQEIQISTYGHNKAACLQRGDPISTIDGIIPMFRIAL